MYKVLTRKRLLQKEDRIRDRTFRKNLKESIHRSHNKIVQNVKKRQYLSDKGPEIRDDIPQSDY